MTRPSTRTAATALAALGLVALSACGSGLSAQTYDPKAAGNSSDVSDGNLAVRHVYVPTPEDDAGYAQGSDAEVVFSAATRAQTADRLVSATSEAASSVTVPDDLVVPVGGVLLDKRLTLVGLTRALRASDYFPLTMTFESGSVVTLNVPVAVGTEEPATNPSFEVPETDSNGEPLVHSEG